MYFAGKSVRGEDEYKYKSNILPAFISSRHIKINSAEGRIIICVNLCDLWLTFLP